MLVKVFCLNSIEVSLLLFLLLLDESLWYQPNFFLQNIRQNDTGTSYRTDSTKNIPSLKADTGLILLTMVSISPRAMLGSTCIINIINPYYMKEEPSPKFNRIYMA